MKKIIAMVLALLTALSASGIAFADGAGTDRGYLVLGEDLNKEEKQTVLEFLKVEHEDDYKVSYTTNQQEHDAFDSYLSPSVVGSRALSSILLVPQKKGAGISVSSYNITYCTVEMYQNALISAGVKDVSISIAAPYPVSGTCALVSAMNAYSTMSGKKINKDSADAAVDEIVTTGSIGDTIGSNDTAAELIALLKQKMLEENMDESQLSPAIDQACKELGVSITDELKQEIIDLLMKIKNTDIDVDALAKQASGLYDKVSGTMKKLDITPEKAMGFFERLIQWVLNLLNGLKKS